MDFVQLDFGGENPIHSAYLCNFYFCVFPVGLIITVIVKESGFFRELKNEK